ncbi:MAG: glycosyltransferase [Chloroflexota bacterium]|mgnify:CR=1 FL=1
MLAHAPIPALMLISQLAPGGAERQFVNLAVAVDRRRYAVHAGVLSHDLDLAPELERAGVPVHSVPGAPRYPVRAVPRMVTEATGMIRRHRASLVTSFLYAGNVVGALAARACGVPAVISERTAPLHLPLGQRIMYAALGRISAAMVVNSYAAKAAFVRLARIPPAKIAVHYNGVDFARIDRQLEATDAPDPRALLGLMPGEPVVGAVGRIDRLKNYELLLRIAAACRAAEVSARFVLVGDVVAGGDVSYRDELLQLRRALGLEERVLFAGQQRNVAAFLRAFELFVLTSSQEGTPNALLEAMAVGVPALVTEAGDAGRIVRAAGCGEVLPPEPEVWAERVRELLLDARRRAAMGANGRQYARASFSMERLAGEMQALWDDILGRRG